MTKTELITKSNLLAKIPQLIKEGWMVLYVIPYALPYQQPPNSTNQYINIPGLGLMSAPIPAVSADILFEVGLMKVDNEPCPKCSYPYLDPERMDRDA